MIDGDSATDAEVGAVEQLQLCKVTFEGKSETSMQGAFEVESPRVLWATRGPRTSIRGTALNDQYIG